MDWTLLYFSCLHRELGLLRQRSQSSNGSKKSLVSSKCDYSIIQSNNVFIKSSLFHPDPVVCAFSDSCICCCVTLSLFSQIKYFHTWLWLILSPLAGKRRITMARKSVRSPFYFNLIWTVPIFSLADNILHVFLLSFLCSWVSCCSPEHIHRGGRVRVSHLCSTSRAPHFVRLLHWADRDYTGDGHQQPAAHIPEDFVVPLNYIWSFHFSVSQMQVEAGIPLQICLSRFSRWLQNLRLNMGVIFSNIQQRTSATTASQKLCTFLTWSGKS